ncbi:GDP-D-glucose phosphorylase 1-like [Actinia tenebrosa]|uniref:GDP-D-glucose phosphorylase 1-like n=1 Tax=Actinia tenebrosa TaxID=6105 RepID=A0A6P8I1V8_ACTTE|nr:GDP-D-glucose phosphorylase 1-like [Actinia tenebrosa]
MSEGQSSFLPCFRYRQSACSVEIKHIQPEVNGIRVERDGDKQSEFDSLLFHRWKDSMEKGCFRYTLDHVKCRTIPGEQGFVAQFNDKRTTKRRKPPRITDIRQPFNPDNFNFNKIKEGEKLFSFCPEEEDTMLQDAEKSTNLIIINDSPVDVGHVLLVPSINKCLPQVLTEESLHLALDMMLLSKHRGLRVCWNSLGALASVNHLHFHAMFLDHSLLVEKIDAVHLACSCYEVVNQSTRGFAFQLHGNTINTLARLIFKVSCYLTDRQVPHNMCMSRGDAFPLAMQEETPNKIDEPTTIRVLLWPKKPMFDFKDDPPFLNACIEPGGFLVMKDLSSRCHVT